MSRPLTGCRKDSVHVVGDLSVWRNGLLGRIAVYIWTDYHRPFGGNASVSLRPSVCYGTIET